MTELWRVMWECVVWTENTTCLHIALDERRWASGVEALGWGICKGERQIKMEEEIG